MNDSTSNMLKSKSDERRQHILDQALGVFMQYGFSRVTMDDIASVSNMSRPALYQYFANKSDIYTALIRFAMQRNLKIIESRLRGDADLKTRIVTALDEGLFKVLDELSQSAHGAELLEMKSDSVCEVSGEFIADLVKLLGQAYGERFSSETAQLAALQLLDFKEGMKQRLSARKDRVAALEAFIEVQLRGLETV